MAETELAFRVGAESEDLPFDGEYCAMIAARANCFRLLVELDEVEFRHIGLVENTL
jgi:hypothetical protein